MENIKKVTCTFYTSHKDIERFITEKIVCSGIVPSGLIKTNITDTSMKFKVNKNLIVVANRSQIEEDALFNVERIDDEIINDPDKMLKFAQKSYLSMESITTHMAYKTKSDYYYDKNTKVYNYYRHYNTPFIIYDLTNDREKEMLYKRNFNGRISAFYLCTKEVNGEIIASLAPVKSKFYLRFIEGQPSNMLNKFFDGTLGSKEEYEDPDYIESIFKKLDKAVDKNIESKNYNILSTIFKNLISNNINNYKLEYNKNVKDRYIVNSTEYIKLEEKYRLKLMNKIRKVITDRNLSDIAESILTNSNMLNESLNSINNNSEYNRMLSVKDYIARDILTGSSFLPREYEEFLFNTPHETEFEVFKARAMRIVFDSFNSYERYYINYSNDSWNLKLCRNALRQLNNLLLTDEHGQLKVPNSEFMFNYNSYEYYIDEDKTKFIFNTFTEEEQEEIFNIIKHIIRVFCINKEFPVEISALNITYLTCALKTDFKDKFKSILLDALESHEGRETNTVKSIITNEIRLGGINIFTGLDKKYIKLRQLQMKSKLQR